MSEILITYSLPARAWLVIVNGETIGQFMTSEEADDFLVKWLKRQRTA